MNDQAGAANGTRTRVDDTMEIARLAALDPPQYEREREAAAEQMGVRITELDTWVKAARGDKAAAKQGQGRPLEFPKIEPWPDRVDGAALLGEVHDLFSRFVVMPAYGAAAVALWTAHTYSFDLGLCTPRLAIESVQKRSGKTTILMLLGQLVRRPLSTASLTAATLYRSVEMVHPCILVDEADHFTNAQGREELRALLNAGFTRGGQALRLTGEDYLPRQFSCFCPAAIALNGRLWDQLEDRSVRLRQQRRLRSEVIERLNLAKLGSFHAIARRLRRCSDDSRSAIAAAEPQVPDSLNDRAADCWRPLFAVADDAGGRWPELARQAALALSGDDDATETMATRLLRDLRELFDGSPSGVLFSTEIIISLLAREEHGWAEMGRAGRPLSTIGLARLLHPFHIVPSTVRRGFDTAKGYERQQFEDAWRRYL
jgi:putative DNA primase/helicase